jgi:RNA exonuclease 4
VPVEPASFPRGPEVTTALTANVNFDSHEMKNGESLAHLRKMVFGKLEYTPPQIL